MQHSPGASDGVCGGRGSRQHQFDVDFDHDGPDDHLALIYEGRDEQFAAAIPFIREGLERGERCVYLADDNTRAEVVEAMADDGIDVATAIESGQLSIHSTDDVSLSDGAFDPEETIEYLEETLSKAVEDERFDHVRLTGEMTWVLDSEDGTVHDALTEYEARSNRFYPDAAMTSLCQYNRERFPSSVLRDVIRTHPRLAYEEGPRRNLYYVPPGEFLRDGAGESTVERQLQRVREQGDHRAQGGSGGNLVREVVRSLTSASSRERIDRVVCDHLTDVDSWQFAWIGETNATSDQVAARATAGSAESYLDDVTVLATDEPATEPAGRAAATRTVQVVDDVGSGRTGANWRREARERGFRSVAAVPLVHEGVSYGVVGVYSDQAGAFDERAQAVLADVGQAVAFACNAMERRSALVSDRATELDLRVPDDDPFVGFVTGANAAVTVDGILPEPEGVDVEEDGFRVFFTAEGATHEQVETAAAATESFSSLSLVSDRDERLSYDGVVDSPGLLGTVVDHAVVPKSVTPAGEDGRVVVRLPTSTDVASFVQMLEERYPGTRLVARREVECDPPTREGFRADLRERLTDRQWDALQMAYLSGYFEWPRERSGEEVGARLDVSQPTFNRHLRDSLRKLLAPIFDDEDGPDG